LGLDGTRSVLVMQLTGILLGLVAFVLLDATVLFANLAFGAVIILGLAIVVWFDQGGSGLRRNREGGPRTGREKE